MLSKQEVWKIKQITMTEQTPYLLGHLPPKPRPIQSPNQAALLEDTQPSLIAASFLKIHSTTPAYTKNVPGACIIHRPTYVTTKYAFYVE